MDPFEIDLSLSMMSLVSVYVVACMNGSFLFIAK